MSFARAVPKALNAPAGRSEVERSIGFAPLLSSESAAPACSAWADFDVELLFQATIFLSYVEKLSDALCGF